MEAPCLLYPGRPTARGGKAVREPVLGAARACTLKDAFFTRYKSVQNYGQLCEANAKTLGLELSDVEVAYGTIDYKIDLSATQTIKARHIGILQDPTRMGKRVPVNVDPAVTMLCETYNAFEKVENVSFRSVRVPATVAPAFKKPPRWPKLQTDDILEK